jgi:hypothetical protein
MRLDLMMQEDLEMMLQKYLKHLKMLKAELRKTKGGSLYIKHCNDRILFTEYKNGHEVGIGKDMQKVHSLARRKYAEVVYRQLENHCRELQQLIVTMQKSNRKKLPDSFIQKCENAELDMKRILLNLDQQNWMAEEFEPNPFYPEHAVYTTNSGIITRSKSEKIIAESLDKCNITYQYEKPLKLGNMTYYPDFTIMTTSGEIIYWEHMGLMDNEEYFIKSCRKLREYRKHGINEHTNLIVTWETDLMDPKVLDHIIRTRLY